MNHEKPLPCPFCAGDPVMRAWKDHWSCSTVGCGAEYANLTLAQWNQRPTCNKREDEFIHISTILLDDSLVAVKAGNIYGMYRVHNATDQGELRVEFEGLVEYVGNQTLFRLVKRVHNPNVHARGTPYG